MSDHDGLGKHKQLPALNEGQIDELVRRANDPAAFVALRQALIDRYLATLDGNRRQQAEDLQAEIDAVRVHAATPKRAFQAIVDMVGDRAEALNVVEEYASKLEDGMRNSGADAKRETSRGDKP